MANLANALKQEISDAVSSQLRKEMADINKSLNNIQRELAALAALQPLAAAVTGGAPKRQARTTTTRRKTGGRKVGSRTAGRAAGTSGGTTRKAPARKAAVQRTGRRSPAVAEKAEATKAGTERKDNTRFSAGGLKAHRKSIDLSAGEYGRLLGVSALSIYNWEGGKAKPRQASMVELAKIKKMGKKEAQQLLERRKREKLAG